jgi:hypothetical protein
LIPRLIRGTPNQAEAAQSLTEVTRCVLGGQRSGRWGATCMPYQSAWNSAIFAGRADLHREKFCRMRKLNPVLAPVASPAVIAGLRGEAGHQSARSGRVHRGAGQCRRGRVGGGGRDGLRGFVHRASYTEDVQFIGPTGGVISGRNVLRAAHVGAFINFSRRAPWRRRCGAVLVPPIPSDSTWRVEGAFELPLPLPRRSFATRVSGNTHSVTLFALCVRYQ